MFLPAIPAYLWLWPRLEGAAELALQVFTYIYVLAGTLYIGLRRWNLSQPDIASPGMLYLGTALLFGVLAYLWWLHPLVIRRLRPSP